MGIAFLTASLSLSLAACGGDDAAFAGEGGDEPVTSATGTGSEAEDGSVSGFFDTVKEKLGGDGSVEDDPNLPDRDPTPQVLENEASGAQTFGDKGAAVDYSNIADGYVMVRYDGDNPKVKLQVTKDGGETYTYDVQTNADWGAFPIQDDGPYTIAVFLNISGDQYSQAAAQTVTVALDDEFAPFLRPNQYSDFTASSAAVAQARELATGAKSDLKVVENLFMWILENITYDYDKAASVQSGYLPNVDDTLATKKGICFDYASLMTAMLRSQRIPCKLVVGYAGEAYHAWISVYVDGIGWVDNMIQFHGDQWTLMDPTFAASGDKADPNLVGSGTNYNPKYYY
ncbi:MAG: transglutaminase-like domain-containing protein [Clostridiales Family XIII bacterium]|nr:transglutaminase-like domain-containing protein [Clostridiales Family XIII bacterium]